MNPYVYMATINPDGTLGSWGIASPALPHGGNDCHAGAIYNGYIYDIAGECYDISSGGYFLTNQVYYAKISTNGTIGTWTETTPVPVPNWFGNAVAMNGYMIFYGGATAWSLASNNITQNVYVAPINGDGTLGSWVLQTAQMPFPVYDSAGVSGGNRIFSIAGRTIDSVRIDTTYWAPFISGTLGAWVTDTNYISPSTYMPAAVGTAADGKQRIYCTGGSYAAGGYLDIVGVSSPIATTASTPIISVVPSNIDFGEVNIGSSIDSIVRISNIGFGTLTVSNVTITGTDFSRFWSGITTLIAEQYIEVTVQFSPSSATSRTGTLTITSNDTSSPTVNVSLAGLGVV
ncbi:MAG: choice-of-anchor D domain-containing protein [bacterium]